MKFLQSIFIAIALEFVSSHHQVHQAESVYNVVPVSAQPPITLPATLPPTTPSPPATVAINAVPHISEFGSPEQNREVEGFIKDTFESFFHSKDHDDHHEHHYDHYEHHEHIESKLCYALKFVEHATFEDISGTGTPLSNGDLTANGRDSFASLTTFKFYETQLTTPTIYVYLNGFISFEDFAVVTPAPNLADSEQGPFSVLAPLFNSFVLTDNGNGQFSSPAIYYTTSSSSTIIQWEVNEDQAVDQLLSRGKAMFQLRIESNGLFYFSYNLVECDVPSQSCAQIGSKPSQADFTNGYKSSRRNTYCNDQTYFYAKSHSGAVLHPYACNKLIGNTGQIIPHQTHNEGKNGKFSH